MVQANDRRIFAKEFKQSAIEFIEEKHLPTQKELALRAVYRGYEVDGECGRYWRMDPSVKIKGFYKDAFHRKVDALWNEVMEGKSVGFSSLSRDLESKGMMVRWIETGELPSRQELMTQIGFLNRMYSGTKEFMEKIGFPRDPTGYEPLDGVDVRTPARVWLELAYNLAEHANRGILIARKIKEGGKTGVELVSIDCGHGIENIPEYFERGKTTKIHKPAGIGLSTTRLTMDEIEVETHIGKGTKIYARAWVK